jgi:tripartite ATP-independent transporter DctM subunit
MSPLAIGSCGILALFALILARIPIGIAMIVVGLVGFGLQTGWKQSLLLLSGDPASYFSSVDMATIPLFLLMGSFANAAGFSADIYAAVAALLGHRRGGLAYATILGSAAFGAVCGSSISTAATFSRIALPEMLKRGYSPRLASGTIAAGGTLKSLIPPSLVMILYCIVSKTFIFDLFIAAVVPALLTILVNLIAIAVATRLDPAAAPLSARLPWRERIAAVRKAAPALVLMLAVFGGLYSGIFTVNEAACVAAVLSLVFALARRRLTWASLSQGLVDAAGITVMLYVIIFGASVFTYFLTIGRVPDATMQAIAALRLSPLATIGLLTVAYLVLGTIFDEISAIVITLPLVLPIVVNAGYDPIWWGVMNVIQVELAMIHPPFGVIVFLLHGMAPQIAMSTIYRGVIPFIIADFLVLIVLTLFPAIVAWLPKAIAAW